MRPRILSIGLAVSAVVGLAGSAFAGSAEDEARVVFQEGLAAERRGAPSACASFRQALKLIRERGPLRKVKECELREGKLVAARETLRELIAKWPQQDAELNSFKAESAALELRIARVDLALRVAVPSGARARLDGHAIDLPAKGVELDPGEHEVLLDLPGEPLTRAVFQVSEGQRGVTTLELPSTSEPAPRGETPGGPGGLRIAAITIGSVGLAGVLGGVITSPLVLSKKAEWDDCRRATPTACDDLATSGRALLNANGALYLAGAGLAAVGGALLIVDLVKSPPARPSAKGAELQVGPLEVKLKLRF